MMPQTHFLSIVLDILSIYLTPYGLAHPKLENDGGQAYFITPLGVLSLVLGTFETAKICRWRSPQNGKVGLKILFVPESELPRT